MLLDRNPRVRHRLLVLVAVAAGLAIATSAEGTRGAKHRGAHAMVTQARTDTLPAPVVKDTPANMQSAFANEVNAKERYETFMRQAFAEGYPAAARLFRACADAESIHALRFVDAISVTGGTARAMLDRVTAGATADNLRSALASETWEAERYYPALLERARAEHWPMSVRALTGALATEREHVRLLAAALTQLDARPAPGTLYVCGYCGRTVERLEGGKCPQCFSPSRRFIHVQ